MLNAQATIKGAQQVKQALDRAQAAENKAFKTSVKVEAFRLSKLLKDQIKSGAPGGRQMTPLTFLARRSGKRFKPNKPLARLALPIRYHVKSEKPLTVAIGWTGPRVSASWKAIAEKQQEGFTRDVSGRQRGYFQHRGDEISTRSTGRKFFFLKRSTKTMHTPARPILDPFWDANSTAAWNNIRNNFRMKMRGQRI